jgi:N-acetylglucosamine kinase-like BadF-type ATPase
VTAAILAVDGGNSKADVALVSPDGRLLGAVRGGTISHQAVGIDAAVARLAALVDSVGGRATPPARAVFGVAGADYPADGRLLARRFGGALPTTAVSVVNDTFIALRAGSTRPWGIALICGQGINGAAVGRNGRAVRFAGVGDISGDWGGGTAIGMAGLGAAVRARDGRGPRTELEQTIPAAVGLRRPEAVTHAFYAGRLGDARVGDLAPIVFATAAQGDAVARGIVDRLADELATMAGALARRAGLVRADPDVVLAGGVFRTHDDAFHERLAARITATIPAARLVRLAEPPVAGAALLALDALAGGVVDEVTATRLRAELRAWSATARVVTSS